MADNNQAAVKTPFMTVVEAADYLTVHHRTLRRYVAEGRLPYYRVGGALRFTKRDLDRYIATLRQP